MKFHVRLLFAAFIFCAALKGMDLAIKRRSFALAPPVVTVTTKDGSQFTVYERFLLFSPVLSSLRDSQRRSDPHSDGTQLKLTNDHMSDNFKFLAPLLCCMLAQEEKGEQPELPKKSKKKKEKEATIDESQRGALAQAAVQLHFNTLFCSALSSACDDAFKNSHKRLLRKLVVSTGPITKTFLTKLAEEEQKRHSV